MPTKKNYFQWYPWRSIKTTRTAVRFLALRTKDLEPDHMDIELQDRGATVDAAHNCEEEEHDDGKHEEAQEKKQGAKAGSAVNVKNASMCDTR